LLRLVSLVTCKTPWSSCRMLLFSICSRGLWSTNPCCCHRCCYWSSSCGCS